MKKKGHAPPTSIVLPAKTVSIVKTAQRTEVAVAFVNSSDLKCSFADYNLRHHCFKIPSGKSRTAGLFVPYTMTRRRGLFYCSKDAIFGEPQLGQTSDSWVIGNEFGLMIQTVFLVNLANFPRL